MGFEPWRWHAEQRQVVNVEHPTENLGHSSGRTITGPEQSEITWRPIGRRHP